MTGRHRGRYPALNLHADAVDEDRPVWIAPGRPDPFRAAGVPDRLVLVLHREGRDYVGTLSTWEYHEVAVHRPIGPDGNPYVVREMVVDTSTPHSSDVLVRMLQRPTAARVVAQLVDVLRDMVPGLAGRDRRMPLRPARHGSDASSHNAAQSGTPLSDRSPLYPGAHDERS